jgi:hypothetical protein
MRQFEQDWLELGSRVARSLHYQARRWQRMAAWQLEAARRTPKAQEWPRYGGTTNAPSGPEEAELLELGRRVAMERGDQSVLFGDPAEDA